MNLSNQIADALGRAKVSGTQASGLVLSDAMIARAGQPGQRVVRDGIRILEGKELIEDSPPRGTTVIPRYRNSTSKRDCHPAVLRPTRYKTGSLPLTAPNDATPPF